MIKENEGELIITKKESENEETVVTEEKTVEEVTEKETPDIVITSANDTEENAEIKEEVYIPQDDDTEIVKDEDIEIPNEETIDHAEEEIKITSASSYVEENQKEGIDSIKAIENAIKDAGLESELLESENKVVEEFINKTKVVKPVSKNEAERIVVSKKTAPVENLNHEDVQIQAVGLLEKFKSYVTSAKFDKKCETAAQKHGVKKDIVKNKVVAGFLGTVADVLGISITLIGDVLMSAVNFIAFIVNKVLEFAVDNLRKLITLLTLNCGETM